MVARDNITDPSRVLWPSPTLLHPIRKFSMLRGPMSIPALLHPSGHLSGAQGPCGHPQFPCVLSGNPLGIQNLSIYSWVAQPWACNANKAQGWSDQLTLKSLMFWQCGQLRQRSCIEVLRFQVMFLYASLNNCNQRGRVVLCSVSSLWSVSWSLHFAL